MFVNVTGDVGLARLKKVAEDLQDKVSLFLEYFVLT